MRYFGILSFLLLAVFVAGAQPPGEVNPQDRSRWIKEIRVYKHEFLAKDLSLSKEQQRRFFPVYDEMEDEIERLNSETRDLELRVKTSEASDLELENASRTIFEQKRAEGQIEMTFFDKFKEILTPQQLFKLKNAERRFMQNLMKSHRRNKPRPEAK